ncbi:MAG: biopolymer transport protein TolR [Patiriisocius sp.]|jgi:biopolymer transport protein TolR
MARRSTPEVNAGSMADIAFLLLIFFLVTTTIEKDKGIARQLPPDEPPTETPPIIKQKNLFIVNVNREDLLLVEEQLMEVKNLRQAAIDFLDNGGASSGTAEYCSFCKGKKDPASSDNPGKAVISVQNDRLTSYAMYITVQNELVAAYNFLRNRESQRMFGWKFTEIKNSISVGDIDDTEAEKYKPKLEEIQKMYPLLLSEAEPKKSGS